MMRTVVKLLTTFFYMGEVPFASGTVASFAGLLLFLSLSGHPLVSAVIFILLFLFGFLLAGQAEKIFGKKDPGEVVIDEVCGIFIVFFMIPIHWITIVSGFLLYRLFDIVKPFPARSLERLQGSYGIMLDDIMSAIYTNLVLQLCLKTKLFTI